MTATIIQLLIFVVAAKLFSAKKKILFYGILAFIAYIFFKLY